MIEPTPATVEAFWKHMCQAFDSTVVPKASSEVMHLVAGFLDVVGIQDNEVFMKHFTTTLGKRIYIPFKVGVPGIYRLWDQLRICVHEHQHIEQGERDGWIIFGGRYLTSPSYRANYEAEAFGCDMEMEYWHRGPHGFSAHAFGYQRALSLENYGCRPEHVEQARQSLDIRAGIVMQGGVESKASQVAITWLNEHVPELSSLEP